MKKITTRDIEPTIKRPKPKLSVGHHGIPPNIHKACREYLVSPQTYVCNLILETNVYPLSWSIPKVIPVPKKEITTEIWNHRPIAILPHPAKIFESILAEKLSHQTGSLMPLKQHRFVRGRSVQTDQLKLTHWFYENFEQRSSSSQVVDVIYTDF